MQRGLPCNPQPHSHPPGSIFVCYCGRQTTLNTMKEETDALTRENDKAKANEQRIRENLVNTLTRKFMEVVKEYQKRQQVRCGSNVHWL